MGRFLTPDPLLNSGRPNDPQTWNRYAYVRNNPLGRTDPSGLYDLPTLCRREKDCSANAANLKQGVSDLTAKVNGMKDGAEKTRLQASLKALGTENDGNNVDVNFGKNADGAAANTKPDVDGNGNLSGYTITIDPNKQNGGTNGWAIDAAHEGTHVSDLGDPRYNNPATTLSPFQLEYRGYQTSAWAADALGEPGVSYGGNMIWNRSWGAVDDKVLTKFLTGMKDQHGNQNHPDTAPQHHNPWPN